jgi:hypothetical protein
MEGITPTMALSFVACVTLGTAALVLFLVAWENYRAVLPGLVVCGYSIRPFQPQGQGAIERRYKDVCLWYGFGVVRIRHSPTAGT